MLGQYAVLFILGVFGQLYFIAYFQFLKKKLLNTLTSKLIASQRVLEIKIITLLQRDGNRALIQKNFLPISKLPTNPSTSYVKMLRAYEIVKTQSKSQKWARLTRYNRFL